MTQPPGYIKYLDFSFGTWETCYLVRCDENWAYIIEPSTYEWLKYINKTHWINIMHTNLININFFQHKYIPDFDGSYYIDEHLFKHLKLAKKDIVDLYYISQFVSEQKKHYRRTNSLAESVEHAIEWHGSRMSKDSLKKTLNYYIDTNEKHKERLLLLLSPGIQRHL